MHHSHSNIRRNASYRPRKFKSLCRAPVSVRKGIITQMKNTSKSFSQSLRQYFREGMIFYAAAIAGNPDVLGILEMSRQSGSEK